MRHILAIALLSPLSLAAAPKKAAPLDIALKDGAGKEIGKATITNLKLGVKLHVEVSGLAPGEHAIHFHEKGSCVGPDFKSAGGHFNPGSAEHGFEQAKGPHAGDMKNFTVGADGKASFDVTDERVTTAAGKGSLRQKEGTALVIHAKADDYRSQPAGNAGDRVACGEISAN